MVDVVYGEGYAKVVAGTENVPKEVAVIDSSTESRERKLVAFLSYLLHAKMKFDSVLWSRQSVNQCQVETLSWNWKDYLRKTSQELKLKQEILLMFTPAELDEKCTPMQKEMRIIRLNNTIKREELLEANLEAMYKVVLSICDPVLKYQVCSHEDHEDIDNMQDTLGLLQCIKKIMYFNGDNNTHMVYNHVVVIINYYKVQQERFQSLQDYRDRFIAYRKVCEQLGLKVGTSNNTTF